MAESWINGYQNTGPGESYAHSPQGADSRGPMKKWSGKGDKPQETDQGAPSSEK